MSGHDDSNGARRGDGAEGPPPPKRSKIAQACEECRARKVRCDGAQPVCSSCRHRRRPAPYPCVYLPDRYPDPYGHIENLESRLRQLEECRFQDVRMQAPAIDGGGGNAAQLPHDLPAGVVSPSPEKDSLGKQRARARRVAGTKQDHSAAAEGGHGSDAMGNISVGGEDDHDDGSPNSSTASFVKHIKDVLMVKLHFPRNGAMGSGLAPQDQQMSLRDALTLPPRRRADEMLEIYWTQVHVLYPFLLRPQLTASYVKFWVGSLNPSHERHFCALLNIMFALCCRATREARADVRAVMDDEGEEADGDKEADVYYQRAMRLLQREPFGQGSVELLQALLLTALYLQSTEWPQSCWAVTGLAIRTAQGMNLHLPQTSARMRNQAEKELSRRLWHGCVLMDRIVAVTLGRPAAISEADGTAVPLPAPIDDEYLSTEPGKTNPQPPGAPCFVDFFVQTLQLYAILARALSALYHGCASCIPRPGCQTAMFPRNLDDIDFGTIIKLDSSLQAWIGGLPDDLKFRGGSHTVSCFARQANVLHIRQQLVQIFLLRPVVSVSMAPEVRSKLSNIGDSAPLPLSLTVAMDCVSRCIRASQGVIDVIHDEQMKMKDDPLALELLPAWWFQVFFVYTAATAIIPAYMFGELRGAISRASLVKTWQRSLAILGRLSRRSTTAARCLTVLQCVSDASIWAGEDDSNHNSNNTPLFTTSIHENLSNKHLGTATGLHGGLSTFASATNDEHYNDSVETMLGEEMLDFTWLDSLPAADDFGPFQPSSLFPT